MLNTVVVNSLLIFSGLASIGVQTLFYKKTIGINPKYKGWRLILIASGSGILLAMSLIYANFTNFAPILHLAIVMLYAVIVPGGTLKERILFGIIIFALRMFSNILALSIVSPAMMWSESEFSKTLPLAISIVVITVIFFALSSLVAHLDTVGKLYLPRKYWYGMIAVFSVLTVGIYIILSFPSFFQDAMIMQTYMMIATVSLLFIWILFYIVFSVICKYYAKANDANILEVQNQMMEKYVLNKQASDEKIKVLSHDLKHSLIQWRRLAQKNGDTVSLNNIAEYEKRLSDSLLINVENPCANAIINQKYLDAYHSQVVFTVEGIFHQGLTITDLDLCSLLGNLLDNANEAAAKAVGENLRCVKLSINRKGNLLVLVVENGYSVEPVLKNGYFATTKKDKEKHAIGMLSIRSVVEKYYGTIDCTYANNWFTATSILSAYTDANSDIYPSRAY